MKEIYFQLKRDRTERERERERERKRERKRERRKTQFYKFNEFSHLLLKNSYFLISVDIFTLSNSK